MSKRKAPFDADRLGSWYTPSKHAKRTAIDRVTAIMAPRSGVTGSQARDQIMAKTLSGAPKVGNRLFTRKRPYKPRRRGGALPAWKRKIQQDDLNRSPDEKADIEEFYNHVAVPSAAKLRKKIDDEQWARDHPKKKSFWDDFKSGFAMGFNGVKSIGQMIPGLSQAASLMPTIGDDNPEEGDGVHKVHRLMPKETKISNMRGTGTHADPQSIKLDPALRDSVAMMTGNTPLDKHAANALPNLKTAHINHIKNLSKKRIAGLTPRRKITKGGRTFTTLRNILVTPDAAP